MSDLLHTLYPLIYLTGAAVWVVAAIGVVLIILFGVLPAFAERLRAEVRAVEEDRERKRAIREHQRRVAKEAK